MTLYNNALSDFLGRYQSDDNEWWRLDHGEAQNMFDAAVESVAVLGARAERAEAERDAVRAEVARLQREKAVAVAVANDREHNEHALEAEVARLRAEIALHNRPMSLKRERRMCAALGLEPITRKRYWRPCLPVNLSADQKRRIMKITEE